MNIDVRIPMGMMFTLMGAVLMAFGLSTRGNPETYARCLGVNLNLWCGVPLLMFGLILVGFGRRGQTRLQQKQSGSNAKRT